MPGSEPVPTRLPGRFWFFFVSRLVSVIGDAAAVPALAIYVYQRNPAAYALAGLFVARVLPRLAGPLTGHLADRLELRRLMRISDLLAAVLFAVMALVEPPYLPLVALVLFAELCAATSQPAAGTAVARIVSPHLIGRANALMLTAVSLGMTVGASAGGVAVAAVGAPAALAVNAGTFLFSAILIGFVPRMTPIVADQGEDRPGVVRTVVANTRRLWSWPGSGYVLLGFVILLFFASLDRPAVVLLTQRELDSGPSGYGLVLGMLSLGALTAGLLMRFDAIRPGLVTFAISVFLMGVAHVALGFAPALVFAALATFAAGVGNGMANVSGQTVIQKTVPRAALGGSMGVLMSTMYLADTIGSTAAAGVLNVVPTRAVFWIAGSCMVVCFAGATLLYRHRSRTRPA